MPTRHESGLIVETRGFVRVLTLDRPERRNALSSALQAHLVEELLGCAEDDGVRAVVLTGSGRPSAPGSTSRRSARPTSGASPSGRR